MKKEYAVSLARTESYETAVMASSAEEAEELALDFDNHLYVGAWESGGEVEEVLVHLIIED